MKSSVKKANYDSPKLGIVNLCENIIMTSVSLSDDPYGFDIEWHV